MNPANPVTHALILFAHGSSQASWRAPFDDIVQRVQTLLNAPNENVWVQLAFLELMQPSIEQVVQSAVRQGIRSIRIVPLFFGVGKHVADDLQAIIQSVQSEHADVLIELAPALGQSEWMRQAMAEYAVQNLGSSAFP